VDPKRDVTTSGRTPSLDDAKAQFLANWHKCRTDRLLPHALLRSRTKCPTCICVPCQRASFHHACRHQRGSRPPAKDWLHEIKHDGFRVIARKIGNRVRLYSRSGSKDVFPLLSPRAHTQPIKISPCRMRVEERSSNKQRIHRLVTSRADAACIAEHSSNVDCPAIAPIMGLTSAPMFRVSMLLLAGSLLASCAVFQPIGDVILGNTPNAPAPPPPSNTQSEQPNNPDCSDGACPQR
jgi:hypothetical protein